VIHLSRSMYSTTSLKNIARVSFPEFLNRGSLLRPVRYRLLSVVLHRGSHNSGHYDTLRRQTTGAWGKNGGSFGQNGVYSRAGSRCASRATSPSRVSRPSERDTLLVPAAPSPSPARPKRAVAKPADRWWRISDEKIKEARTPDVLDAQREAYILFYELDTPDAAEQQRHSGESTGSGAMA